MIQRPSSQHKGLVSGNPLVVVMFHPLDGVLAGLTLGESGVMGRGPSLIVGIDQGQRRGVTNRPSFLSVLTNIDAEGKLGEGELATDDCIFLPGDVLVVNAVEHELRPFRLLRLGRAHSNARTRPRCQVGTIRCCG